MFYTESAAELPHTSAEDVHIPQVCTWGGPSQVPNFAQLAVCTLQFKFPTPSEVYTLLIVVLIVGTMMQLWLSIPSFDCIISI